MRGGYIRTLEHRARMSVAHKGQVPWNKGKTGVYIDGRPETSAEYQYRKYTTNPAYAAARRRSARKYNAKQRTEAIAAYGGRCACCGESEPAFLTFDHVNDDGSAHRREIGHDGKMICIWAKKNGYPKSLQLLCCNCNNAKARGGCPHKNRPIKSIWEE